MKFYGQLYKGALEKTDEFLYRQLYSKLETGFFIECGALNGVSISNCKVLEESLGWSGLNIEPSHAFDDLVVNRPNAINVKCALGSTDYQIVTFHESKSNYAISTFLKDTLLVNQSSVPTKVPIYTYKTLVEMLNIEKVDFFSLDVEGFEDNVLDGMKGSAALPTYIFIETHYSNKNVLYEKLAGLGYERLAYFHLDELFGRTGYHDMINLQSFR